MAWHPRALAALAVAWLPGALALEARGPENCAWGGDCAADDEAALSLRQLRAAARHDPEPDAEDSKAQAGEAQEGEAQDPDAQDPEAQDEDGEAGDGEAEDGDAEEGDAQDGDAQDGDAQDGDAQDDEFDPALPGGWGEAADLVEKSKAEEKETLADGALNAQVASRWGSCARYRCVPYFVRHHSCQCNHDCRRYGTCCADFYAKCHHHHAPAPPPPPPRNPRNIIKLYHQTGPDVGPLILATGFRPGTQGWCGGGIYFATSAEATKTKAIGPDSHKGYLLEATVDVGRVKFMPRTCDRSLDGRRVLTEGFDSVSFDPGDGQEYIVYSNSRILSVRHIPL